MTIKHTYSGKSIIELQKEFGLGSTGFYNQSWYDNEDFAKETPEAGEYEICLDKGTVSKTYGEQTAGLQKGFEVPHPAIVIEAVLTHFKKTGERLLEDWYVRTSSLFSDGGRVCVGGFVAGGLYVDCWFGGHRYSGIGVSAARKWALSTGTLESLESLSLERAIGICVINGYTVTKN